jgi:2-polyprenyl-6-hydroxyphenyl methylase/3-demethylubiquinone-9 3-methyltransferase
MTEARQDDQAVKDRARAMWAAGDFPRVARETIPAVGPALVAAAGIRTGDRVLDVGAGSGATSIPAALAGGDVVASDLTPELLRAGRSAAVAAGVALEWVEADAEALPFPDASFDVVLSSFGAMFAPRHQVVADELVRVTRPGGTIAMANWTPEGWVGQFFITQAPFMPPPPPGFQPPIFWGVEDHVRELFGDRVSSLSFTRAVQEVDGFATPAALVDYYRQNFGPTIMAYRSIGDDAERRAELDGALLDLATRSNSAGEGQPARYAFEYATVVARRS